MIPWCCEDSSKNRSRVMSKFEKLAKKIESKEGYSPEAAKATAAKIGIAKFGRKKMVEKSAAGRKKAEGK
jgi:hypothetical protein